MTKSVEAETKHGIDRQLDDELILAVADCLSRDNVLDSAIFLCPGLAVLRGIGASSDG